MKILITGGAGYVGSILVPQLLEKNYKVCVVDNLMYDNGHTLIHHFKNPKFKFIKGDARDKSLIEPLIHNFEFVIHLAAIVGFPACRKNPDLATSVNVDSSRLISSLLSKDQGTIYASTGSNYGIIENQICTEDTPLNPIVNPSILSMKLNAFVMANNQNIVKLIFNRFAISGPNEKKNSGELNKFTCTPL